jgi:hypothetical protein
MTLVILSQATGEKNRQHFVEGNIRCILNHPLSAARHVKLNHSKISGHLNLTALPNESI